MTKEQKISKANELYKGALSDLKSFVEKWREYYNECGHDCGMSFTHELVSMSEKITDITSTVSKIHNRVIKNAETSKEYKEIPSRKL